MVMCESTVICLKHNTGHETIWGVCLIDRKLSDGEHCDMHVMQAPAGFVSTFRTVKCMLRCGVVLMGVIVVR